MSVAVIAGKAVQDVYTGLTFTPKPPFWTDAVPLRDSGGPVTIPVVVMKTEDGGTEYMGGLDRIETARVTLTVYDLTGAGVKAIVKGISYNGSAPASRAGLDDAAALTLPTGYYLNKVERKTPGTVVQDDYRSSGGVLVYRAVLLYDVELFVDAALS